MGQSKHLGTVLDSWNIVISLDSSQFVYLCLVVFVVVVVVDVNVVVVESV